MKKLVLLVCLSSILITACTGIGTVAKEDHASSIAALSAGIVALERMKQVNHPLEPSEAYSVGRCVSGIALTEYEMSDLTEPSVADRIEYLNLLGKSIEASSGEITRNWHRLGGHVDRGSEAQKRVDNLLLFQGVQVGLLDTDEPVAFATPGGFIWFSEGLLDLCENEDQLAALLCNQLAHILLNHGMDNYREREKTEIANEEWARMFEDSDSDEYMRSYVDLVLQVHDEISIYEYDDAQDLEADNYAARLLSEVGYRPEALGEILQRIADARANGATGRWLEQQEPIAPRIEEIATVIEQNELKASARWNERAAVRQARFEKALGR